MASTTTGTSRRRLLNYGEAAEYLDLGVRHLERAVAQHSIGHYRLNERSIRFSREQLDEYLESCRVPRTVS